jgi:hypothetical protein
MQTADPHPACVALERPVAQASTNRLNRVSLHTNAASFNFTNYVNTNYPSRFFRAVYR